MHPDDGYHDHAGTVMIVAWGQFMDHDFTLTATPLGRTTTSGHYMLILLKHLIQQLIREIVEETLV